MCIRDRCTVFSLGVAAVLFRYSGELGQCIFGDGDVGKYMRILSLLMPVMYLDSVTDGMLRGLGQHMHSMWYNIADSVISLILVYVLLPKWAVAGYIFIIDVYKRQTQVVDINRLLKQFDMMQQMTKQMTKGKMPGIFGGKRGKKGLFGF